MGDLALKRSLLYVFFFPLFLLLASCSNKDYVNAIPESSIAVAAVDVQGLLGENPKSNLIDIFNVGNGQDCGIDLSAKLYVFETVDGNIGVAAKVSDEDRLADWLGLLAGKGYCTNVTKQDDCRFTVLKDAWVVGFSSCALVALGPILPTVHAEAKRAIVGFLGQDSDNGIKSSPIFERLDSMKAHVAIVAQAAALPDKFVAPFTIGAPKDADASQVMLAAGLNVGTDGCFVIEGEAFSFDSEIDKALKLSRQEYRPITEAYLEKMPADAAFGVFINVDGARFITQLHSNKTFQAILTGVNTAIDMDNIIKSIDGDVAIMSRGVQPGVGGLTMLARLRSKDFLDDVGYWKQSCPPGGKITDEGKDAYRYSNGDLSFPFGVTGDMQFYLGDAVMASGRPVDMDAKYLSDSMVSRIKGHRLVMVLNVEALLGGDNSRSDLVKSLFGDARTVLYIMK